MLLKNKLAIIVACSFLAACASNAPAETDMRAQNVEAATRAPAEKQNLNAEDQEICKVRPITGSRFKQKTCMTAAEWENMSHESKSMVGSAARKGVLGNPDGG
jgi:hypothetical protein